MNSLVSIASMLDQPQQALNFGSSFTPSRSVVITPEVDTFLATNCVVAIGVSGGKDSDACSLAVAKYLDEIGHTGPRVLIHSTLGRIEWEDSLPSCQRLAAQLGWELMVVERKAGDLISRWQSRWAANVERYRSLACVRLILPWSTPGMRFCTSELKTAVITSAFRKRFPNANILNVTGIRRQESSNRSRMPVSAVIPGLARKAAAGVGWNPIIDWSLRDVLEEVRDSGLQLHEAYTRYGASCVSCAYCIMSAEADLRAAAGCEGTMRRTGSWSNWRLSPRSPSKEAVGLPTSRLTFCQPTSRFASPMQSALRNDGSPSKPRSQPTFSL